MEEKNIDFNENVFVRLGFIPSNGLISQSINNSVQVNILNLIEQKKSSIICPNLWKKTFEPTLFELEHSEQTETTRG